MVLNKPSRTSHGNSDSSFPTLQLFLLAICRLAEPIALTSIFPIAFPMVKGFKVFADKDVAFWAGILISSFSLSEALTGCYWGALSDRIGRKPVLLLGCFGTMVSMLMMGFATNYPMALVARSLGGLLNGNIGVIQTMVGELVKNPEHEPRAYAIMPFVWSIGTIFGPAIAGLTVNSPLFPTLPYLLPNLICAGLLFISIVIGYFLLVETRQFETGEDGIEDPDKAETESLMAVSGTTGAEGADLRADSYGTFNRVDIRKNVEWHVNADGSSRPSSIASSTKRQRVYTKRVIMLVVSLGIYCYHSMAYDSLFPIFAQDEKAADVVALATESGGSLFGSAGGLGLSTHTVGVIMSVNGMIALFIQGVVFPVMAGWLGVWHLFQIVMYLFPVAYFIVPFLVALPDESVIVGIYGCFTLRNIFSILCYPLILILIKEATSKKHLGKVNGLAASAGATARCIAPPVTGLVYSVGYKINFAPLAWWVAGVFAIIGAFQVFWMRPVTNKRSTVRAPCSGAEHKDVVYISVADVEEQAEHRASDEE